jgi:hypothetical protein
VQSKSPHAPSAWSSRWAQALGEGEHARVSALFLRLFALIHFSAFASFGVQALGLIGSGGILPLQDYVGARARISVGARSGTSRSCSGWAHRIARSRSSSRSV